MLSVRKATSASTAWFMYLFSPLNKDLACPCSDELGEEWHGLDAFFLHDGALNTSNLNALVNMLKLF